MQTSTHSENDASQFRPLFQAGDHWILIVSWVLTIDRRGMRFIRQILDRRGGGSGDFVEALACRDGRLFMVLAISKRILSARRLRRHLCSIGVRMSEGEIRGKDVIIVSPSPTFDTALTLAAVLFDDPEASKAGSSPYTIRSQPGSLN